MLQIEGFRDLGIERLIVGNIKIDRIPSIPKSLNHFQSVLELAVFVDCYGFAGM
jgi:hypothetical protein